MGQAIQKPMISIIVPVYNAGLYLDECINSLLAQTADDIEIICVNDGSTDHSAEILNRYGRHDNRLRIISQNNQGVSAARNRGIKESRGEWVMFVDADDWIDAATCQTVRQIAIERDADMVLWPYIREFNKGEKHLPRLLADGDMEFSGEALPLPLLHRKFIGPVGEELRDPTLLHSWGTVWGKLYRKEVIGTTTFVDTQIVGSAEDALFNIEIFNRVKKAIYINKPMYYYRKHKQSFTSGYKEQLNEQWQNLYSLMENVINNYDKSLGFEQALNNRIALGLIGQGLNEIKSPTNRADKIKQIEYIITEEGYRKAIANLSIEYLPFHWRLFFMAAARANATMIYILIWIITRLM